MLTTYRTKAAGACQHYAIILCDGVSGEGGRRHLPVLSDTDIHAEAIKAFGPGRIRDRWTARHEGRATTIAHFTRKDSDHDTPMPDMQPKCSVHAG